MDADDILQNMAKDWTDWEGGWFITHFFGVMSLMSKIPDVAPTGFFTTYIAALILMPVILYVALSMIWSLAKLGPARKSMTTFFVLLLAVPLYPILTAVILAIIWFVLGIGGVALVTLGPIFLVAASWCSLIDMKQAFVEQERERSRRGRTEDISCMQLLMGLMMGILCLCTVGVIVFVMTIIKSPFLLVSGFCQAWWHAGRAWLKLVQCPCCYPRTRKLRSDETSDSDSGFEDENMCFCWCWFPLIFAAWILFVALGLVVAVLVVILSALVKLLASAIWPAYVTSGWLRYFGTRRRDNSCCTAVVQGAKAGYQVLWASDVLTNAFIIGDSPRLGKAFEQFLELAKGDRQELDPECRRLSCLPPVVVGLFTPSWDLAANAIAEKLGIGKDDVDEAWRSLARQMIRIGREAVDEGLVTKDWVMEMPSELFIGLPARVLLETLERSKNDAELVLSSGLVLKGDDRPKGTFFDTIWTNLMEARRARAAVPQLSEEDRKSLCAALLAGGGAVDDLPPKLGAAVEAYEALPKETHEACQAILRPLVAVSIECGRKPAFQDKLQLTIEGITAEDGAAYLDVVDRTKPSDSEADGAEGDTDSQAESMSFELIGPPSGVGVTYAQPTAWQHQGGQHLYTPLHGANPVVVVPAHGGNSAALAGQSSFAQAAQQQNHHFAPPILQIAHGVP